MSHRPSFVFSCLETPDPRRRADAATTMAIFEKEAETAGWKPTHNELIGEGDVCFICKSSELPVTHRPSPCGCFGACKRCAMKMATGGKCRLCKQFFANMTARPINVAAAEAASTRGRGDEDDEEGNKEETTAVLAAAAAAAAGAGAQQHHHGRR